jgi:hypothetical protein
MTRRPWHAARVRVASSVTGMSASLRVRACARTGLALTLGLLLLGGRGQAAECGPGEGAAIEARWGLQLCAGSASTDVVTHDAARQGARIAAADAMGPAARAGLMPGDVIYFVAGRRVESGEAAAAALQEVRDARTVVINFWRDTKPYLVRIWTDTPAQIF